MKNILIVCLCLMLLLTACGGNPETTTPTAAPTEATQATESTEAPTQAPTETQAPDLKELAKSCIGKSVEELYELIGEPESSDYATSCLGEGEDGNLYYDGFTVYTYREGDEETVRVVD